MFSLLPRLIITTWLMLVALWDRRTGKIPNQMTFPVMLIAGGYRLLQALYPGLSKLLIGLPDERPEWVSSLANPFFVWLAWLVIFALWYLNIMGGGDAKLLMGLFAIFPTPEFTLAFSCLILLIGVPWMVVAHWGIRLSTAFRALFSSLVHLRIFPTAAELAERGRPHAWLFCLPAVIYTWLLW